MESTTYASLSKDGDSKCLAAPLSVPEVTEPTRHPTNASNAPVRRLGKAAFTKTNLLVGATALALTTLCYRYVRYTALKELRDDCRAVALSGQTTSTSPECVRALLGPLQPPPFDRYKTTHGGGQFEDFDEILQECLLSGADRAFPRLWQFLLFGNSIVPDWTLLLYVAVILPAHVARLVAPTVLNDDRFQICTLDVGIWMFCYFAAGLTGIWLTLSKNIGRFLQWSYGSGQATMRVPLEVEAILFLYEAVVSITGLLLTFFSRSSRRPTHPADKKHDSDPDNNNAAARTTPKSAGILLRGWRLLECVRLIPVALLHGWQVLPLEITQTLVRFYLNARMTAVKDKKNPSRPRRVLYLILSTLLMTALAMADGALAQRRELSAGQIEFLWSRQFYVGKVRLDYRRSFTAEVDSVLMGDDLITFNSTYFRRMRQDPVVGVDVLPETWSRLDDFVQRTLGGERKDYEWLQDEL